MSKSLTNARSNLLESNFLSSPARRKQPYFTDELYHVQQYQFGQEYVREYRNILHFNPEYEYSHRLHHPLKAKQIVTKHSLKDHL